MFQQPRSARGFVNEIQFKFTEKKALINIPKIDITLFEI